MNTKTLTLGYLLGTSLFLGSCATTKPVPKIETGACAVTTVIYLFLDENGQPAGMVPTPHGCRCSIKVDGKEYVPSDVEDESKCQKQNGQTSLNNLEKKL